MWNGENKIVLFYISEDQLYEDMLKGGEVVI